MSCVEFSINGKKCTITGSVPRDTTLLIYIRNHLALSGTKAMCREGGCGACIVTVRGRRYPSGNIETFSVNTCLVLVFSCNGWEITTIEGLGNRVVGYDEIQRRITNFNGTQCGYCTPGMVMALNSLLKKNSNMTAAELENSFGSNTCRCTGYRPILDTIKSFALDASAGLTKQLTDIEDLKICEKTNSFCQGKCSESSEDSDWTVLNGIQEPNEIIYDNGTVFVTVYTDDQVFDMWKKFGTEKYMLVDGNTSKGIEEYFEYPDVLIDISPVETLKQYDIDQNLVLGANISLEDCIKIFRDTDASRTDEFAYLKQFADHFEKIAHVAIRNIGSLAGNMMVKHKLRFFQSDVFLLFTAVGAMMTVRPTNGKNILLKMTEFLDFDMKGVLIINFMLPPLSSSHSFRSFKVMPRNQNALADVNAAFLLELDKDSKIKEVTIVFGNISPEFVHAEQTEKLLMGKNVFDHSILQDALKSLNNEVKPKDQPPKPSPECRRKIAIGLFYKFILSISPPCLVSPRFRSGSASLIRPVSRGTQNFQTDPSLFPLNEPRPKYEGIIQSSGEAVYANDIPPLPREVFGAFVLSTIHVGEIDKIDTSSVLEIPGIVAVLTAKDIPGKNSFIVIAPRDLLEEDEEMLVSKDVKYYGQPVAIVVADTQEQAENVARIVKVTYKNVSTQPPVLTIDVAKKDSKRIIPHEGIEPKGKGTDVKKVIKGMVDMEGQYHYYMELISSVVVPIDQRLEVYDSTQWMDLTQSAIAQCLDIQESQIAVKVRRVGGAYGGKLTRSTQAVTACALVARKLNRPCRFLLPMKTNLSMTGKRLPSQCEYEVGINNDGKIQYLDTSIIEDKGYANNDNVLTYTPTAFKNCYNSDYFHLKAAVVRTDLPCNTFVRAPGTTEAVFFIEHIMNHIAFTIKKDIDLVRSINMRTEDNDVPVLLETLKKEAEYEKRAMEVDQFNKANRWMKKAITTSVMVFNVSYLGSYSVMVAVYKVDGTVTVTTGGVEMGQGLNTKARQVCAYELCIPVENVQIVPSSTITAPNNAGSQRSITSECICYAILKACQILNQRLKPVKEKSPEKTWKEIIQAAADEEIDLAVYYSMNDKDPDLESYNCYGVAILEVQLDVLVGRFQIIRVDIMEDVGLSANPLIDVGQFVPCCKLKTSNNVMAHFLGRLYELAGPSRLDNLNQVYNKKLEGAFVQGLGYYTSEKLVYNKEMGKLLTNRSLNYHVPLCLDIPIDFRVKFRYNSKNPKGVLGSKAIGEMGMVTSYVITNALRKCIYESRKESGFNPDEWINIDIPFTTSSLLKALNVKIEEMVFLE